MGYVVAVNDVVVPVALAVTNNRGVEPEGTSPSVLLGALGLGQRELTSVTVPGADQMNRLARRSRTDRERQLSHVESNFFWGVFRFDLWIGCKGQLDGVIRVVVSRPATGLE